MSSSSFHRDLDHWPSALTQKDHAMNKSEYAAFDAEDANVIRPAVTARQLGDVNRTLTYGYDTDRNTFHVYLHEGVLYAVYYDYDDKPFKTSSGPELPAELLRPNKRVHPEYTDIGFARIMRDLGFPLPFTTWNDPNRQGPYYGKTHLQAA
jgi:hypothetical protein